MLPDNSEEISLSLTQVVVEGSTVSTKDELFHLYENRIGQEIELTEVLKNEENLAIETTKAANYRSRASKLAIPTYIRTTSTPHTHAWVIVRGKIIYQIGGACAASPTDCRQSIRLDSKNSQSHRKLLTYRVQPFIEPLVTNGLCS